jgi:Origin recognition complex winged helix C-terminal/Origin recognition complex (ORC) subunit 3 N-terminus
MSALLLKGVSSEYLSRPVQCRRVRQFGALENVVSVRIRAGFSWHAYSLRHISFFAFTSSATAVDVVASQDRLAMSDARGAKRPASAFSRSGGTTGFRRVRRSEGSRRYSPAIVEDNARFNAFISARTALLNALAEARHAARAPALRAVAAAVRPPPANAAAEVVTVILIMRAGAASGDRKHAFSAALDAAANECARSSGGKKVAVARLEAAHHGTVPAAMIVLNHSCGDGKRDKERPATVIVALEDADCFPDDTLRDIVYITGTRHAEELTGGGQRTVFLFGVSIAADSVHATLGVREATMIAPVSVSMPSAETCFHAVVEHVLTTTHHPIVLTRRVYQLLRDEFLTCTTSVARLELALLDIYGLHFPNQSLSTVFLRPEAIPSYLKPPTSLTVEQLESNDVARQDEIRKCMTDDMVLAFTTASEAKSVGAALSDDQISYWTKFKANPTNAREKSTYSQACHDATCSALQFFNRLCEWRWLSSVVQVTVWALVQTLEISPSELPYDVEDETSHLNRYKAGGAVSAHQHLRAILFEEFLPDAASSGLETNDRLSDLRSKKLLPLVRRKLDRISLPQLCRCLDAWIRSLKEEIDNARNCSIPESLQSHFENVSAVVGMFGASSCEVPDQTENQGVRRDTKRVDFHAKDFANGIEDALPVSTDHAGKATKSNTFDTVLCGVNEGSANTWRTRRASGGAAAKEARDRALVLARKANEVAAPVSNARREIVKLFAELLELICPLQDLPMHEVIVFDNMKGLTQFWGGVGGEQEPRATFFHAMRNAKSICGDLHGEQDVDVAEAYQILAEGGRMVNLSDWYHSFGSVRLSAKAPPPPVAPCGMAGENDDVDTGHIGRGGAELTSTTTAHGPSVVAAEGTLGRCAVEQVSLRTELVTQAEFARAVPVFEFVGIIKHTNRKPDHVQRLVFE